jgi:hypothetical protein
MCEDDIRRVVELFRGWVKLGEQNPFFERVNALTWYREPDYHPNYREMHTLEEEINGEPPRRFDLLSIWRLAHDPTYASWARKVGTEACQISFFGTQKTNDWFFRRSGAFQDSIVATDRLLEAGIRPRWQLFFTSLIVPELPELLELVGRMRLRERTEAIGGEFDLFLRTPTPDGEAWNIEDLRPTAKDLVQVPSELRESSEHYLGGPIGEAEGAIISRVLDDDPVFPSAYELPEELCFYVTSSFDVFSNIGELAPWWKLGNLEQDDISRIIDVLENNRVLGLHANYNISAAELAWHYGRRDGEHIYDPGDLPIRWVRMWCQSTFPQRRVEELDSALPDGGTMLECWPAHRSPRPRATIGGKLRSKPPQSNRH